MSIPVLALQQVSCGYGSGIARQEVLRDVNLEVFENEFVAIMGFSGSGKSTLMSLLAGLLVPDTGRVLHRGRANLPPGPDRGIVFQNYSLLPWLTVAGNIALVARQIGRRWPRRQRQIYVQQYIDLVNLTGSESKLPHELSGGMRQRLALARTLAMQPEVLLLDEPLSALDTLTRAVLQDEIIRLWESDRRTVVLVTNDIDEAVLLADRIIPLRPCPAADRGPAARLGPEFQVPLARPRSRELLNFDPVFKQLRNRITRYMMDISAEQRAGAPVVELSVPTIRPRFEAGKAKSLTA